MKAHSLPSLAFLTLLATGCNFLGTSTISHTGTTSSNGGSSASPSSATPWVPPVALHTYYVDPAGIGGTPSDSNPGTIDAPLMTVQAAVHLLQAGDAILLRGGVYKLKAFRLSTLFPSGTAQNPITIEPYNNEQVEFDMSEQYHYKT